MKHEVLVIDDNFDIRNLISGILKDRNFKVREAANYDQAVFEIDKKLPDIAIIDVDNVQSHARDLLGYMIAKPKTFWLTKGENRVYNKLSNNKIKDFEFLSKLGGNFEKK